jgi:hypothetical protein
MMMSCVLRECERVGVDHSSNSAVANAIESCCSHALIASSVFEAFPAAALIMEVALLSAPQGKVYRIARQIGFR